MKKIGLLSDTHGYIDPKIMEMLQSVDEIWHAGDIGGEHIVHAIQKLNIPFRAVYGNIDDWEIRNMFPEHDRFWCEDIDVWMTHIGGYPGKYARQVKSGILNHPPRLFVSGHSHILKVMYDDKLDLLHINPGAAGKNGIHQVRTAIQFEVNGAEIQNLQVIEKKKNQ